MNRHFGRTLITMGLVAAMGTGCIFTQPGTSASAGTTTYVQGAPSGGGGGGGTVAVQDNSGSSGAVVAQPSGGGQPMSGPAGQWSLSDRQYWTALQEELDAAVGRMNTACGTNIRANFVHESFRGLLTEGGTYGMTGEAREMCSAPVEALRDLCLLGGAQQQAVRNGVRGLECAHGPRAITMTNGVARMTGNPQQGAATSSGYRNDFREFIGQHI